MAGPVVAVAARLPSPLAWCATAVVPYDAGWSKNGMWITRKGTQLRGLSTKAQRHRAQLAMVLRPQAPTSVIRQNRIWLALHVAKPHHRADALNVLDLVADAVQDATGLDDRWCAVAGITWDIDPRDPRIEIAVGQAEGDENVVACSLCGLLLPVERFRFPASKTGYPEQAQCIECGKARRQRLRG